MRQVLLYQDEDGVWIADVPSLPGCHSDGLTRQEAIDNVQEAIAVWIEDAHEHGDIVPDDFSNMALVAVPA